MALKRFVNGAAGEAFISSPAGPYDSTTVTGFLAKMRHSADPTGGTARQFYFFPRGATPIEAVVTLTKRE